MTRAFVADASVAIGWVHPAQATKQTAAMLDAIADGATLEVPALWPLEVANALIVLVRRRKLADDERQAGLGWFRGLRVRVDQEMSIGRSHEDGTGTNAIAFLGLFDRERTVSAQDIRHQASVPRVEMLDDGDGRRKI